jgi:hypothetical protein
MSAATFEQTRRQASTLTTVITVLALLLGWGLKMYVEGQTRPISVQGFTAHVPAGWIVRENTSTANPAASDDPFQMEHPDSSTSPNRHYSVSQYPGGDTTFAATASIRTLNRGSSLKLYRILEETPILVNGRDGYKVTFAYVDPGDATEVPTVIQGVDYYFTQGDQTLVITLEVDNDSPTDHLADFLQFVETVEIGE